MAKRTSKPKGEAQRGGGGKGAAKSTAGQAGRGTQKPAKQKRVRTKVALDGTVGAAEVCRLLAGADGKPITRQTLARYRGKGMPYVRAGARDFRYNVEACLAWAREMARKDTKARSGEHGRNALGEALRGSADDPRVRPLNEQDPYATTDIPTLERMLMAERVVETRMKNALAARQLVALDELRRHMGRFLQEVKRMFDAGEARLASAIVNEAGLDPKDEQRIRPVVRQHLDTLQDRMCNWEWGEEGRDGETERRRDEVEEGPEE